MNDYRTYAHTPPHLYRSGVQYFITASTYKGLRLLDDQAQEHLIRSMHMASERHGWVIEDWVVLDNHYHLMASAPKERSSLSEFIGEYHRFTALFVRKHSVASRLVARVFSNYWDTCITHERSYYTRLNYIYHNPVKHGYVQHAKDYRWGSFADRYRLQREYVARLIQDFPYDRVRVVDEY